MKTCAIFIFIFMWMQGTAQMKEPNYYYNKRVHLGVKGGVNLTKFNGKGWNQELKYGFHAGGFIQLKLAGRFSVQGELLFSQMIADTATDFSEVMDFIRFSETRQTIRFNYMDIPLILNIGVDQIHAIKLQLGLQYGLLMNKSQTVLQNGKQIFKNGGLSALGGIQIQLGPVNLGGRYLLGLDNLNNVTNKANWKSQNIQISAGFTL
jgi:Outer membrane protein beta-barrel domain